jgi:hypothetical protein
MPTTSPGRARRAALGRRVDTLTAHPDHAVLALLDAALLQSIAALLAQNQHIGHVNDTDTVTDAVEAIIDGASDLRERLRRYRTALSQQDRRLRNHPF